MTTVSVPRDHTPTEKLRPKGRKKEKNTETKELMNKKEESVEEGIGDWGKNRKFTRQ